MYPIILAAGFCAAYAFLYMLYPLFFRGVFPPFRKRSLLSIIWIVIFSAATWYISLQIPDLDWSNRFLHVFGGGFLSFLICFLVTVDSRLPIRRLRFFVFSFLAVLSLGVANEILEYFLQEFTSLSFASTANDTWMDLISNCVGALLAAAVLLPFVKSKEASKMLI